jgi:hypothetical protein
MPKWSWRRTIEDEAEIVGKTWREVKRARAGNKSPLALLRGGRIVGSGVTGN